MLHQTFTLFSSESDDGNGSEFDWPGGVGTLYCYGTIDTATIKLQVSPDGGNTYIDVGVHTEFTAAGVANFELHGDVKIRGNIAGGGTESINLVAMRKSGSMRLDN